MPLPLPSIGSRPTPHRPMPSSHGPRIGIDLPLITLIMIPYPQRGVPHVRRQDRGAHASLVLLITHRVLDSTHHTSVLRLRSSLESIRVSSNPVPL